MQALVPLNPMWRLVELIRASPRGIPPLICCSWWCSGTKASSTRGQYTGSCALVILVRFPILFAVIAFKKSLLLVVFPVLVVTIILGIRFASSRTGQPQSAKQYIEPASGQASAASGPQLINSKQDSGSHPSPSATISPAPGTTPAKPSPPASFRLEEEFEQLRGLPQGTIDSAQQMDSLVRRWAEDDPALLVDWALRAGRAAGEMRTVLDDGLSYWARHDPAAAFKHLQSAAFAEPVAREFAYTQLFTHWAAEDGAAAWQGFQRKPAGPGDEDIRGNILEDWATRDAAAVGEIVRRGLAQGHDDAHLGSAVVRGLLESDPDGAVAWVESLPAGKDLRVMAEAVLIKDWAASDHNAAANWLLDRPVSAARDAGIESLVLGVQGFDPAGATAWAAEMSPGSDRDRMLRRTLRSWLREDPEAAATFIRGRNEFSAREKEEMIREAQER